MVTRFEGAREPSRQLATNRAGGTRTLRVLIVIENMSYTYDTRIRKISRTLARVGHQVTVICPRYPGDPASSSDGDVTIHFYPLPRLPGGVVGHVLEYLYSFVVVMLLSCAGFVKKRFDAIHICNPPDIFFPIGKLYRLLGSRFVFDQHDLCPELSKVRYGNRRWLYRAALALERWTYKAADYVLVTSEAGKERAIRRGGVDTERLTLVYNGPDMLSMPDSRKRLTGGGVVEVGYVGDMNPQDGIEYLLRAAWYIRTRLRRTDVRFVLIGDGSAYLDLQHTADQLELGDAVEFTGRLRPREAMLRLAACDLCVLPDPKNDFTDGVVMVKSLEYMALGKAFVAFDLKETRAICGEAALYAQENDFRDLARGILNLIDDSDLRWRLGQTGRRKIEAGLSWNFCERALLQAYERVGGMRRESTLR